MGRAKKLDVVVASKKIQDLKAMIDSDSDSYGS